MSHTVYEHALVAGTIKESTCKKCGAKTITAKVSDKSAKIQWQCFDNYHSELTKPQGHHDAKYCNQYKPHYMYCFPEGLRYKYGDKIIYAPFKETVERFFKVIGVDDINKYYYLQDMKNPKDRMSAQVAYFVDKKATPLTEAAELLFT
jgi:hypothetical protein